MRFRTTCFFVTASAVLLAPGLRAQSTQDPLSTGDFAFQTRQDLSGPSNAGGGAPQNAGSTSGMENQASQQTAAPTSLGQGSNATVPQSAMPGVTPGSTVTCTPAPQDATQSQQNCTVSPTAPGAISATPAAAIPPGPQTAVSPDAMRQAEAAARAAALQNAQQQALEQSQQVRTQVPYRNLPVLRDLYTQVPSANGTVRRFGSDAFLFGTGNADQVPSDLPVGPDYILGPGDQLVVNMWGARSERLNITVDRQGQIALPEAGTIVVNGMSIARAQDAVQRALNTQFKEEHAEISIGRVRTIRVYVVGDVQRPGAYDVSSLSTPLSVLYAAGGPTARGSLRILRQMRGDKEVARIDLYDFLLKGVRTTVERLEPGDTLLVPTVGSQVTVEGAVHHPAIYELNNETNLTQVLDLAGGPLNTASLKQIEVSRVEVNSRRTMLSLELPATPEGARTTLADFHVQNGDDVVISAILPYNQEAVYLAGHVFRPGQYAYREGMTLTDVLRSYQDILPEPAERGQIVRLAAPDFHPEAIPFNLPEILLGNAPVQLRPFDTVEVFGRYERDAPSVKIEGQVLRPGLYPLPMGMTVSALVNLAGGFDRSAYRQIAGLTNYKVVDGKSVEVGHVEVDLMQAMAGDKQADSTLKPGDVLSIRQIEGWTDIGSSITVSGEVAHPGGYGLSAGERLSSVIERAGGFRPEAYPEAATLTRVQVQVLAELARQDMIQRLETAPLEVKPGSATAAERQDLTASLETQRLQTIAALRARPAAGRMVVNLTSDVSQWQNTAADIVVRAGDAIVIPKRPNFVLISGQVYNPTAISFVPGRDAGWYLNKGGGASRYGDAKRVFVLRADGSVVAHDGFGRGALHVRIRPGDAIVVPEKFITGSQTLRDVLSAAQIAASFALTAAIAGGL